MPTGCSRGPTGLRRGIAGAGAIVVLVVGQLAAAPPDVKFLFPSGLQQGTTRTVKLNGKRGTAPVHAWCDDDRLSIEPGNDEDELTVTAAADVPPGLHWVRLFNDEGASGLLPVIVGVVPETTEAEFRRTFEMSGETDEMSGETDALPITLSGVLSRNGEVDVYPVSLEKGQTLIASVESRRSLGAPADVVLQLVSEAGFVIEQSDDFHGFDPQIVSTVEESGTFTVRVFAFPAEPNSSIRFSGGDDYTYRLTLTTGPFIDHRVPLSLPAGGAIDVRYVGWNIPDAEQLVHWPGESDAQRSLFPYPATAVATRVQRAPLAIAVEESRSQNDTVQPLAIGSAVTGHLLRPWEVDGYTFDAEKDQRLLISVAARSFDSPLDPVLRVLDTDGKPIEEEDDISRENVDVRLDVKIPADGTYRAEVTDRFSHGGMRYVYELRIEEDRPRVALTLKNDRYTLAKDKPAEIPVTIDRQGGFDEEITVTIRGLPEDVSADAAVSQPKGGSAKQVKLKLESEAPGGFSGPIEILGTGPDDVEVLATTPTPSAAAATTKIWLTVLPAPADNDKESAEPSAK